MHNNAFYQGLLFELNKQALDAAPRAVPFPSVKPPTASSEAWAGATLGPKMVGHGLSAAASTIGSTFRGHPLEGARTAGKQFLSDAYQDMPQSTQNAGMQIPAVRGFAERRMNDAFANPSAQGEIPENQQRLINETPLRENFDSNVTKAVGDHVSHESIGDLYHTATGQDKPQTGAAGQIADYVSRDPVQHQQATMAAVKRAPGAIWDWVKENPGTTALAVLGTTGIAALLHSLFSQPEPDRHDQPAPVNNITISNGGQGMDPNAGHPRFL
jgi:hypothetical protein